MLYLLEILVVLSVDYHSVHSWSQQLRALILLLLLPNYVGLTSLVRVFTLLAFVLGATLITVCPFQLHYIIIIFFVSNIVEASLCYYRDLFGLCLHLITWRAYKVTYFVGSQAEYSRQRKTLRFFLLRGMWWRLPHSNDLRLKMWI